MENDVKVKIGSMWFRADDFDAKINILTADDNVIRYEYLKRNDDGSLILGRANREHFLETFIEWDDDYERLRPGSIWEAVQGCGQAAKGKQIKILSLMGDLVEWTFLDNFEKDSDHCTCKSSFLYCFTRIADNDNGAVYRTINPPIGMVKVKNTKPTFSISPVTIHVLSSVEYVEIKPQEDCKSFITNGKDFHSKHELFSMNPEKDFTVPLESNVNNGVTVGSIWRGVEGMEEYNKGRLIKVVHITGNLISWRHLANAEGCPGIELSRYGTNTTCESSFLYCFEKVQDNDDGAVYRPFERTHDSEENPHKYQMVKVVETNVSTTPGDFVYGTIKYITIPVSSSVYSVNLEDFHSEFELFSLNPAEEFCVDANDPNYSRKLIDPNKGESKMENNGTYLKTDASKLEDFGTGAKREDKSGKGRYDLIPGGVMQDFEDYVEKVFTRCEGVIKSPTEISISSSAYFDGWLDKNNYYKFILNVTAWNFVRTPIDKDEMTYAEFREGFYEMRKALAKHYEAGAKVHGVDNWKKGLPIYGSERGGCFLDSMRRHTDQMLQRKTDEPHAVAALWNAFCALWTLKHKPYSATYQNASVLADRKSVV